MSFERLGQCLVPAAIAAAPLLAIIVSWSIGPGTQPASALAAAITVPAAAPATFRPTADQLQAAAYAAELSAKPLTGSPFDTPAVLQKAPALPTPMPKPAQPVATTEFKLTAIVGGRETVAVLNGKLRRTGQEAAPGWTVESIDANAGTVTLRHAQLGTQHLNLRPPTGGQTPR